MTLTKQTFRIWRTATHVAILLAAMVTALHAAPAAGAEKPAVIQLDFIIGGKHAPWFVAAEKGFYSRRGLAVTIQASKGSADTVRAIAAGLADVGFADLATDRKSVV